MSQITDKDGVWEVTEGNGCINKCLIEPSVEYLTNNPVTQAIPTLEEKNRADIDYIAIMTGVVL
jgi:hypothetical protein